MTWHDHKDEREHYNRKLRLKWNSEGWCPRHLEHTMSPSLLHLSLSPFACMFSFSVVKTASSFCSPLSCTIAKSFGLSFGPLFCPRQNHRGNGGDAVVPFNGLGCIGLGNQGSDTVAALWVLCLLGWTGEWPASWPCLDTLFIMLHGKYNTYVLPC